MDGNIRATRRPSDFWNVVKKHCRRSARNTKPAPSEANSIGRSTITQAEIFHDFMRAVWDNAIKDESSNTKYNEYSDARSVAQTMGAKVVARVGDWNGYFQMAQS